MAKLFEKLKGKSLVRQNIESDYVLETKDLGISFGGLKAAQNVNLKIKKNEIYGLIGPNGAGKTTIFNLLTGAWALPQYAGVKSVSLQFSFVFSF